MPTLHDPVAISFGPFDVRWYALFILVGIVAGISLSSFLARYRGLNSDVLLDLTPWVVILGIVGARTYYVLLEWSQFKHDFGGALNIRSGGLSIHGGMVAGLIVTIALCRRWQQPVLSWLDVIVPGLAIGQGFGRWGNWANQEAFGRPTTVPWAVSIDPDRRPAGYEAFSTFHPTFLYESAFNVANAIVLSWLIIRRPRMSWMRQGDVAAFYLMSYGVARFIIERMRTDSLYIGPLPAALWFSIVLVGGGAGLLALNRSGVWGQPQQSKDAPCDS